MSVIRGSVGFLTFFLAFALRHLHASTWWFGFVLLASAIGSLFGSLLVPVLRRYLSEQQLILYSLVLSAARRDHRRCPGFTVGAGAAHARDRLCNHRRQTFLRLDRPAQRAACTVGARLCPL